MRRLGFELVGEGRMGRKGSHIAAPLPQLHGAAIDVFGDAFDGGFVIVKLKFLEAGAKAAKTYEIEPVIHRGIHPTGGSIARLSVAGAPKARTGDRPEKGMLRLKSRAYRRLCRRRPRHPQAQTAVGPGDLTSAR